MVTATEEESNYMCFHAHGDPTTSAHLPFAKSGNMVQIPAKGESCVIFPRALRGEENLMWVITRIICDTEPHGIVYKVLE